MKGTSLAFLSPLLLASGFTFVHINPTPTPVLHTSALTPTAVKRQRQVICFYHIDSGEAENTALQTAVNVYIERDAKAENQAQPATPTQVVVIDSPSHNQGRLLSAVYNQLLYDQLKRNPSIHQP